MSSYKNDEKTLLILDIDETLIHASERKLDSGEDFRIFDYYVYKRPYLDTFLKTVHQVFLLALWSSASDEYVEAIAQKIIPNEIDLEFVWARSRCTYRRNYFRDTGDFMDYKNHYHYIKPLKKLKRKGYLLDRILIVDDSPHKSKDNYGNAIYPKAFLGDSADNELELLAQYLQTLKDEENVRSIEKRNWRNEIR